MNSDFVPLPDSFSSPMKNGSVLLKEIDKAAEGMYKCNISNGIGNSLIKTIIVKVIGRPFFYFYTKLINFSL